MAKKFVLLTFVVDGFTACLNQRDVGPRGASAAGDLSRVSVGDIVSAYWQEDGEWFEAKVRRYGAEMMKATDQEKKQWEAEFMGTEDGENNGEENEEDDDDDEEEKPAPKKKQQQCSKPKKRDKKEKGRHEDEARAFLGRERSLDGGRRRRDRSRSRSRSHSRSRSRSPKGQGSRSAQDLRDMVVALQKQMEEMKKQQQQEQDTPEVLILSKSYPEIKVNRELLKQKINAGTKEGQAKGVYDLLVSRADQAKYCGRGRGKTHGPVPPEIFGAMRDFFQAKWGADPSKMLVWCINEKGCQARYAAKKKETTTSPN